MFELFVMGLFGIGIYIFARKMERKPILPWNEDKKPAPNTNFRQKRGKNKKHSIELDQEPDLFKNLLFDIKEIDNHMIRYYDNTFVLISEVTPVNYFLLSQAEQEAIDVTFERWLAQLDYHVRFYLQNRYIDLSDPIKEMQEHMQKADDLHANAIQYGESMVNDLIAWQQSAPRFETKRYLIFTHQVNKNEITADTVEELEERIIDRAFRELYRRYNTAKTQLRKARMEVELLTGEGIAEVLYHTFNRRKAVKNRFKDFGVQEMLALYTTADQDETRIELVKEGLDIDEPIEESDSRENKEAS